jgi:type IV pilus assembly protein PilB
MSGAGEMDLAEQAAREGIKNLRESGLLKVKQGLTSLDEVLSTTNV